jgi:hypothetical protein
MIKQTNETESEINHRLLTMARRDQAKSLSGFAESRSWKRLPHKAMCRTFTGARFQNLIGDRGFYLSRRRNFWNVVRMRRPLEQIAMAEFASGFS